MATIPKKVQQRFAEQVSRYQRILQDAKSRDINEADTAGIIKDILADVFGFDKYTEVTSEFELRGTYCDLAVRTGEKVKYLVEVKAVGLSLKDAHLRQAVDYGAKQGVSFVVLTNGLTWEIHQIRFEQPIRHEELCLFNFMELDPQKEESLEKLFLLCKEGLSKAAIEEYQERVQALNRFVIGAILLTEDVIGVVRRGIRRVSSGLRVEPEEVASILEHEVIKREVLEGDRAAEARHRVKRASARSLRKERSEPQERRVPEPSAPSQAMPQGQSDQSPVAQAQRPAATNELTQPTGGPLGTQTES
jgi:hypothetical protein